MSGISVDLKNELTAIDREVRLLGASIKLVTTELQLGVDSDGADRSNEITSEQARSWLETQGLASGIEKIYTGCEKVMARVASIIDGTPITLDEGWHIALLRRMANPYPEVRGPIISQDCYNALNRFRAFRHRERSSYGVELDAGIVLDRGEEVIKTFSLFSFEIETFLKKLESKSPLG